MNSPNSLQTQESELRELLQFAQGDPVLEPQLRSRLDEAQAERTRLERAPGLLFPVRQPTLPRAAIFLSGGSVQGSTGIKPSLAGESLIQYEKMFVEQALHDERESARIAGRRRRPKGAAFPSLLFTGTPRGSFGLEFSPVQSADEHVLNIHGQSLQNIAAAMVKVSGADSSTFEAAIKDIPPRVLTPMKKFFNVLAQHGAELRLALSTEPSHLLTSEMVMTASELLERELSEEEVWVHGTFRGVTRESGFFDLNTDEAGTITGSVADDLTEDDLERIDGLTNKRCLALVQKTVVHQVSGGAKSSYLLIEAKGDEPTNG